MKNFKGINKKEFKNGLTLITEKVPGAEKVALLVGGMSGSVHESEKLKGGSHFNEHMLFKSNKHRTASEITETIEYNGAAVNAFTSYENTAFYVKALPSKLGNAVEVIFEAATNFKYNNEEFEKERGVILTEIRMGDEDPFPYTFKRLFLPTLFQGSSYEKSVIGTTETMGEVTKKQLEDFKKKYYVPNNMVVVAVGNFDEAKLIQKVESTFGKMRAKKLPPHDWSADSKNKAQEIMEEKDEIKQIYLLMGNKIPIVREDNFKLEALDTILSGGLSCRFFRELREKRGIGYAVGFMLQDFREIGMAASYIAGFKPEQFDEARNTILAEFTKLQKTRVPDNEFTGRMKYGLSMYKDQLENVGTRCSLLLRSHLGGSPFDYRDLPEHMERVTRKDVMDAANKYLDTKNYVLAALVPKDFKK